MPKYYHATLGQGPVKGHAKFICCSEACKIMTSHNCFIPLRALVYPAYNINFYSVDKYDINLLHVILAHPIYSSR